ncbi:MAG TPA: amino acid ABC transporter permease [Acidimicrobiales bacterium]|nr:amino acid ABC transporter permease [Acidimicrobiales bacterium]
MEAEPRDAPIKAVPVRHPGRWVAAVVLVVLVAMLVHTLLSKIPSPTGRGQVWRFGWDQVGQLLFSAPYLQGVVETLWITLLAMVVGITGGLLVATLRVSPNPLLSGTAWTYTWFFRGTPVIVQIFFWYNILTVYPSLSLGVPFGPAFWHLDPNKVITGFIAAAVLGLGLNEAAYMAEIFRAGILSIDAGQQEAAQSLGMGRILTLRKVVFPQAMRVIIPPTSNEVISMLKTSSLAAFVGIPELFFQAQATGANTAQLVPPFITISLWYLAMTSVLSVAQYFLERHYRRGTAAERPDRFVQLWARMVTKRRVAVFAPGGAGESVPVPAPQGGHG